MNEQDLALLVERAAAAIEADMKRRLLAVERENDRLQGEIRVARARLEQQSTPIHEVAVQ